ncbi:MotA/TolQ/ExbB proton channel family protein [Leeia sp. TBRC 13508]|uniref:Biopolymer transport protein ExbB n=1 Tax=Leeia speluncae TaxID=2884804 RepID=A0ABS8D6A6_9NEIS|nr:MotA/TolQ/ExbB proton channel family protein [Leeia speluncae]MCB6183711.1 MotA/TolQ/ExbB proton channel family protein [Leeia speluncae]
MNKTVVEAPGIFHFLTQADGVGKFLFGVLCVMSVLVWGVLLQRAVKMYADKTKEKQFNEQFWNANSLEDVSKMVEAQHVQHPFANLTRTVMVAKQQFSGQKAGRLAEVGGMSEYLTREMRKALDEQSAKYESGLTLLGSIAATAPFVGLFGTVWGVYRALVNIGMSGAAGLEQVAGPVGEALIMTGVGLAVAIPAVLAYNMLNRYHRLATGRLDAFAHDLYHLALVGEVSQMSPQKRKLSEVPAAA